MSSAPARDARPDTRWLLAVTLLTAVAAALRLYQIGVESFWVDELTMMRVTSQSTPELLRDVYATARAPLYPLLAHFWQQVFGPGEGAVRALSALFGTLSVPLVALIGRKLFDERTGLIAALLMALSVFQLYFSQEHRYYSLAILLTVAAVWFFIRARETGRYGAFALYALFTVLHVYTHPLSGVLFGASMGLYLLARWRVTRRQLREWIGAHVLIVVGVMPTVILRLVRSGQGAVDSPYFGSGGLTPDWLVRPPFWEPARTLVHFLLLGSTRYLLLVPAVGTAVLFVVGMVIFVRRRGGRQWLAELRQVPGHLLDAPPEWRESMLLVLFWLAAPMVISYVLTFTVLPIYFERYLALSAPALYVLIAALIPRLRHIVPPVLSLGLLVALLGIAVQQYYEMEVKEQWDELAAYVERNEQPGDALAFSSDTPDLPNRATGHRVSFNHYYDGDLPQCEVDVLADNPALLRALQECAGPSGRVWLMVRYATDERVEAFDEYIAEQVPGADGLLELHGYVGFLGLYLLDVG